MSNLSPLSARQALSLGLIAAAVAFSACADSTENNSSNNGTASNNAKSCPPNTRYNPIIDQCVSTPPEFADMDEQADSGPDTTPDQGGSGCQDVMVYVDGDGDGFGAGQPMTRCLSQGQQPAAGESLREGDCDDQDAARSPDQDERCDGVDNNCNSVVDDGLSCRIYAHTANDLYAINPFTFESTRISSVDGFFDLDTDAAGVLYGMTTSTLYRFDDTAMQWRTVGNHGIPGSSNPNGFAIERGTRGFVTAGNELYEIDISTATSRRIGAMGGSYRSSGDCVVNKGDILYMTSSQVIGTDLLVRLDGQNAQATTIGNTGFGQIYGLTFAWNKLFGVTGAGQLIEINPTTGTATLLHTYPGLSWYGAASSPQR